MLLLSGEPEALPNAGVLNPAQFSKDPVSNQVSIVSTGFMTLSGDLPANVALGLTTGALNYTAPFRMAFDFFLWGNPNVANAGQALTFTFGVFGFPTMLVGNYTDANSRTCITVRGIVNVVAGNAASGQSTYAGAVSTPPPVPVLDSSCGAGGLGGPPWEFQVNMPSTNAAKHYILNLRFL
jgi:hypothetical protein